VEELITSVRKTDDDIPIHNPAERSNYEEGEIYDDTMVKIKRIERKNSVLKARRASVLIQAAVDMARAAAQSRRESAEAANLEAASVTLTETSDRLNTKPVIPDTKSKKRPESIEKRSILPPIRRDGSINEFNHRVVSRQASMERSTPSSQRSQRRTPPVDTKPNTESSMFKVKPIQKVRPEGVVSYVTGDLSVKLTKVQSTKHAKRPDLNELLRSLPPTTKGTTKFRPLSSDTQLSRPIFRRIKSSAAAMVVYGIRPPALRCHKDSFSLASSMFEANPVTPGQFNFQKMVMAVRATNRIGLGGMSMKKIWKS